MSKSTLSFDFKHITTPKQLEQVIDVARSQPGLREQCERRAREFNRDDLIPSSWSAPTPTPPASDQESTRLLDMPAAELMGPDRHEDLDRLLRQLAADQHVDYFTAYERFTGAHAAAGEILGASTSVGAIVAKAGVTELNAFQHDVRLLEERDAAVTRTLDAALVEVNAQQVNDQGTVLLDSDFDVSALLHSDEALERRWRRARELAPHTYGDRPHWEADDRMHLEGGLDLLKTLARPAAIAQANATAAETARELDQVIESHADQRERTRELDAAIAALTERRENLDTPTGDRVRTLDSPSRDKAQAFVDLTAAEMAAALEAWDARGRGTFTLDMAAAEVAGFGEPARRRQSPAAGGDDLDARVRDRAKTDSSSYLKALEAVTGISIGAHPLT